MNRLRVLAGCLCDLVHRYFLWLLVGSYAAAAMLPTPGQWLRNVSFGELRLLGQSTTLTLPMLLLALLLASAGLGVCLAKLKDMPRLVLVAVAGLAAGLVMPLCFVVLASSVSQWWLEPGAHADLFLGLAVIAAMPIAGSSTAWSQNAGGNLGLSLALVVVSTLLSPITTPAILHAVDLLAGGNRDEELCCMAAQDIGPILMICVAAPCLLGLTLNRVLGESRLIPVRSFLKLLNGGLLVLLLYANASASLPDIVAYPDHDFMAVTGVITGGLCLLAFTTGWWLARVLKTDGAQQTSLMYGLGMSNNGAGLVLVGATLAEQPQVMFPIIVYNFVQHLVAVGVASWRRRPPVSEGSRDYSVAGPSRDGSRTANRISTATPARQVTGRLGEG
jgi:bile acid:Na+ symporter, BASS family